jgi:hypothetical protein
MSFIVNVTITMIVNNDCTINILESLLTIIVNATVIMIVNYDCDTFIEQIS